MRPKYIPIVAVLILFFLVGSAAGEDNVINNTKRVGIYIENTTTSPMSHDSGFGSMLHEYNITYFTNDTLPGNLSTSNYDLLVIGSADSTRGSCSNSTAKYVNDYIASGGCVWFISEPRNESKTYILSMSNATWGLPANKFYCLGALTQQNISGGASLTVNIADPATSFMTSPQTILATVSRYTDSRNFGGENGVNAYGYNYTELIYYNGDTTKCQLAKVWNDTTGARIIYSNTQTFISGGDNCYFNASTGSRLFNNMKQWVLRLDNNTMQVSVTYPRGDKQFVACFDDLNFSAPVSNMDNFFNMIDTQPNDIGITSFVIPTGRQDLTTAGSMANGYNYLVSKSVDANTIHPHQNNIENPSPASVAWGLNGAPLADMQTALGYYMTNYSAGANNNPNFYSIRFPQTVTNTTSSQAAVNLGFKIASDYGPATTMGSISESHLNMRWLQKQKILSGVKTSQIEIEAPSSYDTGIAEAGGTPSDWTTTCEAKIPSFLAMNYPSVHQLNGHYQWSMINASWTGAVRDILWYTDNQTSYTAYTNLSTLALYEIAMQDADIRVDTSGHTTTATVTAVEPIHDFTLKLQNITSGIAVSLDGTQLTADHVIYEDGVYYVFADISTGTHTLTVADIPVTGGAKYIGKNGGVSVNISNGAFVKNNAASAKTYTAPQYIPYTNCTNAMSASGNTISLAAHNISQQVDAVFTPTGGDVNVTIAAWNSSYKRWNESSATHGATMYHIIGGLESGQYTALKIDGATVAEITSDDSGYIGFNYTGGYSEHEFEVSTNDLSDFDVVVSPISSGATDNLETISVNATGVSYSASPSILGSTVEAIGSGYNLAILLIMVLAMVGIVRLFGY